MFQERKLPKTINILIYQYIGYTSVVKNRLLYMTCTFRAATDLSERIAVEQLERDSRRAWLEAVTT